MSASEFGKFYAQRAGNLGDFSESVMKGVDIGSKLAERQAELDIRRSEAEMRKTEHDFKKNEYVNSFLKQALSEDATPAQRNIYLKQYEAVGKKLKKLPEDYSASKDTDLQLIVAEDARRSVALQQLLSGSSSPEMVALVGQMSPEEVKKTYSKVQDEKAAAEKNAALFGNKLTLDREKQYNSRIGTALKDIKGDVPPDLLIAARSQDPVTREIAVRGLEMLAAKGRGNIQANKDALEQEKLKIAQANALEKKRFTDAYIQNVQNNAGNQNYDNQTSRANLTSKFRQEWSKTRTDEKNADLALAAMDQALKSPSAASRTAVWKTFQKLYDPSVVHVSEYGQQQEWKDFLNRTEGVVNALKGQGDFTERDVEQMKEIALEIKALRAKETALARSSIEKTIDDMNIQIPKNLRIDKTSVFGAPPKKDQKKAPPVAPPTSQKVSEADVLALMKENKSKSRKQILEFLKKQGYDVRGL